MATESTNLGDNVSVKIDGTTMTITVDLAQRLGESSTGKSLTVASTHGNLPLPGHPEIKCSVNIYAPLPKGSKKH